jgi:hypothetical protein
VLSGLSFRKSYKSPIISPVVKLALLLSSDDTNERPVKAKRDSSLIFILFGGSKIFLVFKVAFGIVFLINNYFISN